MKKLFFFFSFVICFFSNAFANEYKNTVYQCPTLDQIKTAKYNSLTAQTTMNGVSVTWSGWMQSSDLPNKFKDVYFQISPNNTFYIICDYSGKNGAVGEMYPDYASYVAAGTYSGPWTGYECDNANPTICKFLIKRG